MALLPLDPPGAAPVAAPPSGFGAVKADAGLTVGGMRDMISVAREFVNLFKEAEPLLRMMRPPEPVVEYAEPVPPPRPMPRAPVDDDAGEGGAPAEAPRVPAVPPRDEKVEAAREELRQLVEKRLSKANILQLAAAFGPLAIGEKMPKLGEALANHADETDRFLQAFSEDELRAILVEVLPLIPAKDVPLARMGLSQAVQAIEKEAAEQPAPAEEPKKDGEDA